MGILKKEPPGRVASVEELMAIAHAIEREAARHYRELSQRMRARGEESIAALLASLEDMEDDGADRIDARARAITGKAPDLAAIRWELPEKFDEEASKSYLLTPYRVLAIAVRNEERAFAFYSYVAAGADDERVRRFAEELAKDELSHAKLLRRERRKAWRREGRNGATGPPRLKRPESVDMLRQQAAAMERAAAEDHRSLAAALRGRGDTESAALFDEAAADEENCAASIEARPAGGRVAVQPARAAPTVWDGLQSLEFAFERYSNVAESADNEEIMLEAQSLAERALRRLARVQGSLGNALPQAGQGRANPRHRLDRDSWDQS